jgi:hypothetical protein
MYPAVLGRDVREVFVPLPPDGLHDEVKSLVQDARKHQHEFAQLVAKQKQAMSAYLEPLVAPPPSPLEGPAAGISCSIRRSSEFSASGKARFDAEFFRAEYDAFENQLHKSLPTFRFGEYFRVQAGRVPGRPVEDVAFVKQAALTNAGVNWSAVETVPGSRLPMRGRVKDDDILIACTAHEIYYVARRVDYVRAVPEEITDSNVAVADLLIAKPTASKPKSMAGSYVAAFLRSPWGLHQVRRCIRGLQGGHVYAQDVEQFVKIPIPAQPWIDEFEQASRLAEHAKQCGRVSMAAAEAKIESWLSAGPATSV